MLTPEETALRRAETRVREFEAECARLRGRLELIRTSFVELLEGLAPTMSPGARAQMYALIEEVKQTRLD